MSAGAGSLSCANLRANLASAKPYFGPVSGGTVGRRAVGKAPVWEGALGRGGGGV